MGGRCHLQQFVVANLWWPGIGWQIRDFIAQQLQAQGIVFHFGESPIAVEKNSSGTFNLVTGAGKEEADLVMFATGRAPNTSVQGQILLTPIPAVQKTCLMP